MTLATWLTYATLCALFAMSPGPAVILTMTQSMARGVRAGVGVIAGVELGNTLYFALSGFGLGAVLATSETAFLTIKYAGALYLIYLGFITIRDASKAAAAGNAGRPGIWRAPVMQGLVNQLANPKAILFYAALFPQFVDYQAGNLLMQLLVLAVTDIVIEVPILIGYAALAARGRRLLSGTRGAIWRERIAGMALIGVGGALSLVKKAA
jgi:homoserine/homoserine lactone efflux protein